MSVFVRIDSGNLFHAVGPETENARSPILVRVRGTTKVDVSVSADLRPDRVRTEEDKLTMSVRYDGQLPTFIEYISRHSLYCILKVMGSQCRSLKPSVMWSVFLLLSSSLAAAFCTRCSGAMVHANRHARTE